MHILHLISSPRGELSFSIKLGNAIVEKLIAANEGSTVKVHHLLQQQLPHLDEVHLNAFRTAADNRSKELEEAVKLSDDAIAELNEADVIVVGVPIFNFSIPSNLKAWIDHVARAGKTFKYSENGPEGLVKNKRVYLAISSGDVYSEGPMKAHDFAEPYLRSVLRFLGIDDVTTVRVEGVSIPGLKNDALGKAIDSIVV